MQTSREFERDYDEGENSNAGAPATKPVRGRPKIIRTGKPGRPAKRKHEVPIVDPQENGSESEEDAIIAEIENYEDNGEFVGFISTDPISEE